jgi:hypothetical protein
MPVSSILICAALCAFVVEIIVSRGRSWLGWGLALLTAAQLFYGR